MIDYVLQRTEDLEAAPDSLFREELENVQRYANFLNSELKLEMLATVDGSSPELIIFTGFEATKDEDGLNFKCGDMEFSYDDGIFTSYMCEGDFYMGTIEDIIRFAGSFLVSLELNENGVQMIDWKI